MAFWLEHYGFSILIRVSKWSWVCLSLQNVERNTIYWVSEIFKKYLKNCYSECQDIGHIYNIINPLIWFSLQIFRDDLRYWLVENLEDMKLGSPDTVKQHAEIKSVVAGVKDQQRDVMEKLCQEQRRLEAELHTGSVFKSYGSCYRVGPVSESVRVPVMKSVNQSGAVFTMIVGLQWISEILLSWL